MAQAWLHGHFFWNELMTRDVERAKRFYGQSVGWTFEPVSGPGGVYWIAKAGDDKVGGLFPLTSPAFDGVPEGWMAYLAVDYVDARVHQAIVLGATLMRPIFDVPGVGRVAILREPGGAGIGWITPVKD
jgi:predicted enzyme related to lactoylglutathione lyase